ncbi:glycosyltransferase [Aeromonas veronii]|uniref:glycosyltransferase n=1 Tax=Aeromonas veronii TaxID=654 RepID=UPI003A3FBBB9
MESEVKPAYLIKPLRVAVIVPIPYRGGSLRAAKLLVEAFYLGSKAENDDVEIIFLHPDLEYLEAEGELDDLPKSTVKRSFKWMTISPAEARRAMCYSGNATWEPDNCDYFVPDDGIQNLCDCDVWVIVSDRLEHPILPIRPVVAVIYDYLQRYRKIINEDINMSFLSVARRADKVIVTTKFTYDDALQYAGLDKSKLSLLPMLAPDFSSSVELIDIHDKYFVWTTNKAIHKNHLNAVRALKHYYEVLGGNLKCIVTGVDSHAVFESDPSNFNADILRVLSSSLLLSQNLVLKGELSTSAYKKLLANAEFLWHPASIDNGTFSVIEAAYLKTPGLSSNYPAMREINEQFNLSLKWMDSSDPYDMADKLLFMQENAAKITLPSGDELMRNNVANYSECYWLAIKELLK